MKPWTAVQGTCGRWARHTRGQLSAARLPHWHNRQAPATSDQLLPTRFLSLFYIFNCSIVFAYSQVKRKVNIFWDNNNVHLCIHVVYSMVTVDIGTLLLVINQLSRHYSGWHSSMHAFSYKIHTRATLTNAYFTLARQKEVSVNVKKCFLAINKGKLWTLFVPA